MKVPENLYHYTSIESLLSIINGIDINNEFVKFRSTHIAYLNDMTEGRLLQNALKKNGINEDAIKILEACKGYPFVMSLSENSDDLNMWRNMLVQVLALPLALMPKHFVKHLRI